MLRSLGASLWLIRHHELVLEAARQIVRGLSQLPGQGAVEWQQIEVGAALHDAGKIEHPGEMSGPGSLHEVAGEALLLRAGVPASLARFCRTHASWSAPGTTVEDRLVALADKLWKGKRDEPLEAALRVELAALRGVDPWSLFVPFDSLCEDVAARGAERLRRSEV